MLIPLEKFLSLLFSGAYSLTNNYGLSLLALSLMVNLILLPVYMPLEKWKKKKAKEQAPMKKELEAIKRAYKGRERYFYTRAVHRRHHFHPIESVILSLGLLIQIPFFLAAYQMLSHYSALEGVSFWFIQNLGAADSAAQFAGIPINVLPLIMTILNVISAFLYTKEPSERKPLWILAAVFLVLLYKSPAGLVLYWTANNIFALIKQLPEIPLKIMALNRTGLRVRLLTLGKAAYFFMPLFAVYLGIVSLFYPGGPHSSKVILPSCVMILLFMQEIIHLIILVSTKGTGKKRRLSVAAVLLAFLCYQAVFGLGFIPDYISTGLEKLSSAGVFKRRIAMFSLQAGMGLLLTFPFIYHSVSWTSASLGKSYKFQQRGLFSGWEEIFLSVAFIIGAWRLWIPLMIYSSLPDQFSFSAGELLSGSLFSFFLIVVTATGIALLTPRRWRIIPWIITTSCAFAVFLYAFIIPFDFGFLTGFSLSKNETLQGELSTYLIDFFIIAAIMIFINTAARKWRKGIFALLGFLNIMLIGQGIYALSHSGSPVITKMNQENVIEQKNTDELTIPLSKTEDNVVVFMMDMMTGGYLFEILKDSPELKEHLDGFTWFPNTMAVATNTVAGQPAIMGGPEFAPAEVNRRDLKHSVIEEIGRSYQVMIDKAQAENLDVTLVEPYSYSYLTRQWPSLQDENINIHSIRDYVGNQEEYHIASADVLDESSINKRLLQAIALFRVVPYGFKSLVYDGGYWRPLEGVLVYQSYFKKLLPEWLFLKSLPELTSGEEIKGQYYFITSLLAHHPHALSKEGELLYDRFPDPNERDNRKGRNAYYSTEWSLKILGDWCTELKKRGLYDNTKIIIVSDHGNYRSNDFAAPLKNGSDLSALGLDKVNHTAFDSILLFKDYSDKGSMEIDSRNMSTSDTGSIAFNSDGRGWIEAQGKNRTVEGQLTHAWSLNEQTGPKYESFGVYQVSGDFYDIKNWKKIEE